VGFDPQESFAKMDEDGGVKDTIGVYIEVLNTVVLQESLEEVARWESQPTLHEPREHRDVIRILLHWVWISRGGAPHVDLFLSEKSTIQQRQQVLSLGFDFFHSLLGFGCGGDTGGVDPAADPAASSRDLFFPPTVFKLLDDEGFILQVHRVFNRIRSGAAVVAIRGGAPGSTIYTEVAVCTGGGF
jgi:hypothetical protein